MLFNIYFKVAFLFQENSKVAATAAADVEEENIDLEELKKGNGLLTELLKEKVNNEVVKVGIELASALCIKVIAKVKDFFVQISQI